MADKSLVFPAGKARKTMFSEREGHFYPTQAADATVNDEFAGEYRGFYPDGGDVWKPASSKFDGRDPRHRAADVYAGYAPFPRETPIYAIASGYFFPMYDADNKNPIGNRAGLTVKLGDAAINLRYGHLSRFHGGARFVTMGDLIGFAGCSGNADTQGECTGYGDCNLSSCHVHLLAWVGALNNDNKLNPEELLGWQLAHANASGKTACNVWPGKPAQRPQNPRQTGWLNWAHYLEWWRDGTRRDPLPAPFEHIYFDSTSSLKAAVAAYDTLRARLSDATHGTQILKKMRDRMAEIPVSLARDAASPRLGYKRPKEAKDELSYEITALADHENQEWLGAHVARALMQLRRLLWCLTGGDAIRMAMSNRLIDNMPGHLKLDKDRKYEGGLPQCGIGVGGIAHLVSVENSASAHHISTLNNRTVHSLDFGRGSIVHAIWPTALFKEADWTSRYVREVDLALLATWRAAMTADALSLPLSKRKGDKFRKEAATEMRASLEVARQFILDAANLLSEDDAKAGLLVLLPALVNENRRLYLLAQKRSEAPVEVTGPIGPAFSTLEVEQPPHTPAEPEDQT